MTSIKINLKNKRNSNQIGLDEDFDEEKNNDNMVTDDEEVYRENNENEEEKEKDITLLGKKRSLNRKK